MGLLLTRRPGESIEIGEDITITVAGIRGNQVRLDFEAPDDVKIWRKEIADRMRAEQQSE